MLQVNFQKGEESQPYLRDLSLNAKHPRTRECFLALYDMTEGKNATQNLNERKLRFSK